MASMNLSSNSWDSPDEWKYESSFDETEAQQSSTLSLRRRRQMDLFLIPDMPRETLLGPYAEFMEKSRSLHSLDISSALDQPGHEDSAIFYDDQDLEQLRMRSPSPSHPVPSSELQSPTPLISWRTHPLYSNVSLGPDGLYHCPWERDNCGHRPEQLKCNYDKNIDSHLKPYKCKVSGCDPRFSSTACLLRHEREAHAMHGHGERSFFCEIEGCDRSMPSNGFARNWNLRDHMKRVHNRSPCPTSID